MPSSQRIEGWDVPNAKWSGSCPDGNNPDYEWEMSVHLDGDGDPLVSVSTSDVNGDQYGLACLTPTQARQAAAVLVAAANRIEELVEESR